MIPWTIITELPVLALSSRLIEFADDAVSAIPELSETVPLQSLQGVGPRLLERLQRLGIRTLEELLFHLPLRYQDRTRVTPACRLPSGVTRVRS